MDTLDFDRQTEDLISVDDKVVALVRWVGRGKTTGAQGEISIAMVWTIRDQAITRVEFFLDRAQALEAVGLSEKVDVVLRAAAELWHPNAELRDITFDEFRAEIEETVDCGTHIVCATRWVGRGSASGIAVDVSQVDVYEVRDGKIVRATLAYPDKATAIEAAGLSE
jgi:ketosteroid isomerase-like protein